MLGPESLTSEGRAVRAQAHSSNSVEGGRNWGLVGAALASLAAWLLFVLALMALLD